MGLEVAAVVVAGIGAATAVYGAVEQRKAGKEAAAAASRSAAEQRLQFQSQQRIADIRNARERAQIARQQRIQRGKIAATGANTGTSGSSGVVGGMASVDTQAATNLGVFGAIEANQTDIISSQIRGGQAQAQQIQAQADMASGQAMFNLGSTIFQAGGGFKTIFDAVPSSNPASGPYNSAYHGSFGE